MKKLLTMIISALTALVMCFALIACGNDAPPPGDTNTPSVNDPTPGDTDDPTTDEQPITDEVKQKAATAVEKLLAAGSFKGRADFSKSSKNSEEVARSFDYDKRGYQVKAQSLETDGAEYVIDIRSGYAYKNTEEGYAAFQVIPSGTIEYLVYLIRSASEQAPTAYAADVDNAYYQAFMPTGSYDQTTDTIKYVWSGADEINKYITPLTDGYRLNKTIKATLNDYLLLFTDGSMNFEMLYDALFSVVKTDSEFTVEQFNAMLAPYGIDIYAIIENIFGQLDPTVKAAIDARKVGEIVSGVYDYLMRVMPQEQTVAENESAAEKFTLEGLLNAAFFAQTEYSEQKLDQIKSLLDLALMMQMRAAVNRYIAPNSPELAELIKSNVKLTKLGYEFSLTFDDGGNIGKLGLKACAEHNYSGEESSAYRFLNDNNYNFQIDISFTDYSNEYEPFVCEVAAANLAQPIFAIACYGDSKTLGVKIESPSPLDASALSAAYRTAADGFIAHALADGAAAYNAESGEVEIADSVFAQIAQQTGGKCAVIDITLDCGDSTVSVVVLYLNDDIDDVQTVLTELVKRYTPDFGGNGQTPQA